MNKRLSLLFILPLLTGCAGLGRPLIDAVGGAGGAGVGYVLSDGDPWITGAGAAGGVILAEGAQALARSAQRRSYRTGYEKGRSDAVKTWYYQLQDQQRLPVTP
jgi:hypothetical protein